MFDSKGSATTSLSDVERDQLEKLSLHAARLASTALRQAETHQRDHPVAAQVYMAIATVHEERRSLIELLRDVLNH